MIMPNVIFLGFVVDHINFDSLLDTPTHEERTVDHFADCNKRNRSGMNTETESPFRVLATTTASPPCVGNGRFIVQPNPTNNNRNLFASNYAFVNTCGPSVDMDTSVVDNGNGNWRLQLSCNPPSGSSPSDSTLTLSCAAFLNVQDIQNIQTNLVPTSTCSLNGRSISESGGIIGLRSSAIAVCTNVTITAGPDFDWTISARCPTDGVTANTRDSTVTFGCYDFLHNITDIADDGGQLTVEQRG